MNAKNRKALLSFDVPLMSCWHCISTWSHCWSDFLASSFSSAEGTSSFAGRRELRMARRCRADLNLISRTMGWRAWCWCKNSSQPTNDGSSDWTLANRSSTGRRFDLPKKGKKPQFATYETDYEFLLKFRHFSQFSIWKFLLQIFFAHERARFGETSLNNNMK